MHEHDSRPIRAQRLLPECASWGAPLPGLPPIHSPIHFTSFRDAAGEETPVMVIRAGTRVPRCAYDVMNRVWPLVDLLKFNPLRSTSLRPSCLPAGGEPSTHSTISTPSPIPDRLTANRAWPPWKLGGVPCGVPLP